MWRLAEWVNALLIFSMISAEEAERAGSFLEESLFGRVSGAGWDESDAALRAVVELEEDCALAAWVLGERELGFGSENRKAIAVTIKASPRAAMILVLSEIAFTETNYICSIEHIRQAFISSFFPSSWPEMIDAPPQNRGGASHITEN